MLRSRSVVGGIILFRDAREVFLIELMGGHGTGGIQILFHN